MRAPTNRSDEAQNSPEQVARALMEAVRIRDYHQAGTLTARPLEQNEFDILASLMSTLYGADPDRMTEFAEVHREGAYAVALPPKAPDDKKEAEPELPAGTSEADPVERAKDLDTMRQYVNAAQTDKINAGSLPPKLEVLVGNKKKSNSGVFERTGTGLERLPYSEITKPENGVYSHVPRWTLVVAKIVLLVGLREPTLPWRLGQGAGIGCLIIATIDREHG